MYHVLIDQKKKIIASLLETQPEVKAAYLFGSQHKKTSDQNSDIDIAVLFAESENNFQRELELEHRLSDAVGGRVDVRSLGDKQSPVFLMQAAQGELLVGHNRQERVAFEVALSKTNDDAEQYFRISQHYV